MDRDGLPQASFELPLLQQSQGAMNGGLGRSRSTGTLGTGRVRRGVGFGAKNDEKATQEKLYTLLLTKEPHEDDLEIRTAVPVSPCSRYETGSAVTSPVAMGSISNDETSALASGSSCERALPSSRTFAATAEKTAEIELERQAFLSEVCTENTRKLVREGVNKCFLYLKEQEARAARENASDRGGRRRRTRSSAGNSDSEAGESIAASRASRKAPSLISEESLVVNHDKGFQPLSGEDRLRAYLAGTIPELTEHVRKYVLQKVEGMREHVDTELADEFLLSAKRRGVFKDPANWLRWQNQRRTHIRSQMEADMQT